MECQLKKYISCFDTFFKYLIADNIIKENCPKNETLNNLYFLLQTNLKNTNFNYTNITMSKVKVDRKECIHILTSGPRRNLTCSKKTTLIPDTNIPSDFCSTHYKKVKDFDERHQNSIPSYSDERHRDAGTGYSEEYKYANSRGSAENQTKEDEDTIVIRKNKFNNFVFGKTGLIIKSSKEKYIVAREAENGDWLPLSEEDIDECKRYHLKYKIIDFNFTGEKTNKEYIKSTKIISNQNNYANSNIDDFIDIDENFVDDNLK